MIFRQLFEPVSSSYTYLLGCEETGQAILIDPVINAIERDQSVLAELGMTLAYTLDTHIHADHITSAKVLRERTGSKIAAPAMENLPCADTGLVEGTPLQVGSIVIDPLHTPGHTDGHFSYRLKDRIFTGDTLLIDGCGRTDFQNGNSDDLFQSVTGKIFTLPEDTLVYPGHDYNQRQVTTVGQEKLRNPRLKTGTTLDEFRGIMAGLNLKYPTFIDFAVPGNQACGQCPSVLPEELEKYCGKMSETLQG